MSPSHLERCQDQVLYFGPLRAGSQSLSIISGIRTFCTLRIYVRLLALGQGEGMTKIDIVTRSLVAITVCVDFASILELIIPINRMHFEKWYVITERGDEETIEICRKYGEGVVELIHFDFRSRDHLFNKGGGIRLGQSVAHDRHSESCYLILDADILLPDNFTNYLNELKFLPDILYGVEGRHDYPSIKSLENNIYQEYKYGNCFTGFFQLYIDREKYYDHGPNIDKCDDTFREQFSNKIHIEGLYVRHLGRSGLGRRYLPKDGERVWDGTLNERSFLMDGQIASNSLSYNV